MPYKYNRPHADYALCGVFASVNAHALAVYRSRGAGVQHERGPLRVGRRDDRGAGDTVRAAYRHRQGSYAGAAERGPAALQRHRQRIRADLEKGRPARVVERLVGLPCIVKGTLNP